MTIKKGRAFRLVPVGLFATNQIRWASVSKEGGRRRRSAKCSSKKIEQIRMVAKNLRIPFRTRKEIKGKRKLVPKSKAQLCVAIGKKAGRNETLIRDQIKLYNKFLRDQNKNNALAKVTHATKKYTKTKAPKTVKKNTANRRKTEAWAKVTQAAKKYTANRKTKTNAWAKVTEAAKKYTANRKAQTKKLKKANTQNEIVMNKIINAINTVPVPPPVVVEKKNNNSNSNNNNSNNFMVVNRRTNTNNNSNNFMVAKTPAPRRITPVPITNTKNNQNKVNNSYQIVNWNAAKNKKMTNKEIEELTARVKKMQEKRWNNMIARIEAREMAMKKKK